MPNQQTTYYQAVGRRKEAVARVRLFAGQGQLTLNGLPISQYFKGPVAQRHYQRPFEVTKTLGQVTGNIKVTGGGFAAQLDAVTHAIARALDKIDRDSYHGLLRSSGMLTRDPRVKERRKYGLAGKARAKKQSPKR